MRGKGAGFAYDVPFHNPSAPRTDYAPLTTITKEPGMMYVHSAYWQYTHNKKTAQLLPLTHLYVGMYAHTYVRGNCNVVGM